MQFLNDNRNILYSFGIIIFLIALAACTRNDEPELTPVHQATPYTFEIPPGFPTMLNIPEDNPLTLEGIELGRYLFYDTRLAGRADEGKFMTCASCHIQENGFVIGMPRPHPYGLDGDSTHHAMLPLINLVWNPGTYGWNGSVPSIEEDVRAVITDPTEFNSSPEAVVEAIQNISGYPELFEKAFGSREVTLDRIARAIAQFVRTLISSNSKFDRYLRGEIQLTQSELKGFVLFTTEEGADCFHCHGGAGNPLFTTHKFYNNGKDTLFTDPADRYSITGDPMDRGAYKASTLRNIEFTAPYMNDGRFNTLDEVIEFYSHHLLWSPYIDPLMHHIANGGTQLTPSEKTDLKAFLLTLSDTTFINNPKFGKPEKFPDEP
ncbi:MAG: cytochrome-c peroxidase [Bacteroidetes bacterium]|nr:cytochrome-c peroxidase [Bacteroidota bacterium]